MLKSFNLFLKKGSKYIYTFAGNIIPMLIGFVTVPFTLDHYGVEVVGFISICWLLVGYTGIFDLGLSRSMTQMVSKLLPTEDFKGIRKYFWTTFIFSILFSLLLTIVVYYYSSNIISLFNISNNLENIVLDSFRLLSLSVPFIISGSVLVGILTAYNNFNLINIVKIPIGMVMMLAPVISFYLNIGIIGIIYILLLSRILSFICYLLIIYKKHSFLRKIDWNFYGLRDLLNQGLWMTLSNVISPLIVNFDRFVLGSLISIQAVAYYSTVYDVISKLHIIPTTFVTVLFPMFAYNSSSDGTNKNSFLISKFILIVLLIISPIIFTIQIWSYDLISIWINPDFAINSYKISMILLIGIFWNCLAQIPFTFLQANGYSSKTALFHIIELLLFIPILYLSITKFGITGAALAWSMRVVIDFVLLFCYSIKVSKQLLNNSILFFAMFLSTCLLLIILIDTGNLYFKIILNIFMFSSYLYFFKNNKYIFYDNSRK